jgi:NAD(P)-dependent dehydrogenase (short-subunit alcohol dehydrogenase family)
MVTGASSGIGYELARCCAQNGFDLLIAADDPEIHRAAEELRQLGASVVMKGEGDVVTGLKNKLQSAVANVTPAGVLAKQHRNLAEPQPDKE